jgi:hypothetical protein
VILSQRQVEALVRAHGSVVLPVRARLTPSAQDWVRHQKLSIRYDDVKLDVAKLDARSSPLPSLSGSRPKFLWWSDGPCGICKAALGMCARDASLEPLPILEDATRSISAIRSLSSAIASHTAHGGVLVAKNASVAALLANKSPMLRAVIATTMAHVEEAVESIAANVLVVQREAWALHPLKNLIARFCKLERKSDRVAEAEIASLAPSGACLCKAATPPTRPSCSGCPCAGSCGGAR